MHQPVIFAVFSLTQTNSKTSSFEYKDDRQLARFSFPVRCSPQFPQMGRS